MYVSMHVCICVPACRCIHLYVRMCRHVGMSVCIHASVCLCVCLCKPACGCGHPPPCRSPVPLQPPASAAAICRPGTSAGAETCRTNTAGSAHSHHLEAPGGVWGVPSLPSLGSGRHGARLKTCTCAGGCVGRWGKGHMHGDRCCVDINVLQAHAWHQSGGVSSCLCPWADSTCYRCVHMERRGGGVGGGPCSSQRLVPQRTRMPEFDPWLSLRT